MVDSGGKKTFIDKLLFALKPKKSRTDIVEYAEKIIDNYTGITAERMRRRDGIRKAAASVISLISVTIVLFIMCYALKRFF